MDWIIIVLLIIIIFRLVALNDDIKLYYNHVFKLFELNKNEQDTIDKAKIEQLLEAIETVKKTFDKIQNRDKG